MPRDKIQACFSDRALNDILVQIHNRLAEISGLLAIFVSKETEKSMDSLNWDVFLPMTYIDDNYKIQKGDIAELADGYFKEEYFKEEDK